MRKLITSLLIFLCIFTGASFVITYLSIVNTNKQNAEENNLETVYAQNEEDNNLGNTDNQDEKGIDLYGTYNENDLLINELVINHQGVDIKIPEIDGLIDTNVQNKVNQDIYNRVFELVKKYSKINYAEFYTNANFSNIVSIVFYVSSENGSEDIYLNYNLVDGERLKLEDIFMGNTDIKEIVRSAFFEPMVCRGERDNGISSINENEYYKVIKGYMDSKEKKFSLSPKEIYLYFDDYDATVGMVGIADRVSIYTKYLTNNTLYTRNDIGYKNIFTCAIHEESLEKLEYGYLENNFWYDITVGPITTYKEMNEENIKKFEEFKVRLYNEFYDKINEYREIAKKNTNKFYILLIDTSIYNDWNDKYLDGKWITTYSNMIIVNEDIRIFEMPRETYEKVYKDKLISAYRSSYLSYEGRNPIYLGVSWYIDEDDEVIVTNLKNTTKLYNYITGEEINSLTDIFYEDSNYIEVIKNKTRESLVDKYNYSEIDAENLLKTINYELEGARINVNIPQLEGVSVIIYFDEFDVSMMKIFDV